MIAALVIGTLLAVFGLCYVLYPLFYGVAATSSADAARAGAAERRDAKAARADAVAVLREIEFDRETGKLSDADYSELKADYTRRALDAMREEDRAGAGAAAGAPDAAADPVEAAIRRARAHVLECAHCGPRPEPDATYCSDCGRFLPGRCADCGAAVEAPGAQFCNACGRTLVAA